MFLSFPILYTRNVSHAHVTLHMSMGWSAFDMVTEREKQKQNPLLNYICFARGMHLLPFCNITQLKKRGLQLIEEKKSDSIPPQWCQSQNESWALDVDTTRQLIFILHDLKDQRHILISLCWSRKSSETAAITLVWRWKRITSITKIDIKNVRFVWSHSAVSQSQSITETDSTTWGVHD